jgi:hypothetical protein
MTAEIPIEERRQPHLDRAVSQVCADPRGRSARRDHPRPGAGHRRGGPHDRGALRQRGGRRHPGRRPRAGVPRRQEEESESTAHSNPFGPFLPLIEMAMPHLPKFGAFLWLKLQEFTQQIATTAPAAPAGPAPEPDAAPAAASPAASASAPVVTEPTSSAPATVATSMPPTRTAKGARCSKAPQRAPPRWPTNPRRVSARTITLATRPGPRIPLTSTVRRLCWIRRRSTGHTGSPSRSGCHPGPRPSRCSPSNACRLRCRRSGSPDVEARRRPRRRGRPRDRPRGLAAVTARRE